MSNEISVDENGLVNGSYEIASSFKADGTSDEKKQVTLRMNMVNMPIKDVLSLAAQSARIAWVNNVGRKQFDVWENGQVVNVDMASPGKAPVDNTAAMIKAFIAAGINPEQAKMLAKAAVENPALLGNILK